MKLKKLPIIIIGILVIFIVSFLIRELIIYNDGKLDKSNYVPREEIITLLNKGAIYNNYYYCPNNEDRKEAYRTEYYIKDNIQAIYLDSKLIEWTDYNNFEKILLTGADETATVVKNISKDSDSQCGYDYSVISKPEIYNNTYKYLGEKEEDGRKIIVIELSTNRRLIKKLDKYYIDKETGLILGRFTSSKFLFITTHFSGSAKNRNIKFNIVTNENITKPDLNKYKIVNYIE